MATTVVSARVDEELKSAASAYISEAGTTMGEVMKTVLAEIVRTKQVPMTDTERARRDAQHQRFLEFMSWRDSLPESEAFEKMSPEQMRDLIVSSHA